MEKLSEVMERSLISALGSASKILAKRLVADGVPTVEILTAWISEAMEQSSEALSQKAIDSFYSVEALRGLDSVKVNLSIFMGMIKGECAILGMKAAAVYDLGLTLKVICPPKAFEFNTKDAMKMCANSVKGLSTKISSAIASYVVPAGIAKSDVLKVFSEYEETMMGGIMDIVNGVVSDCIAVLKTRATQVEDEEQ